MSTTIDSLAIQVSSNAAGAEQQIDALAKALERLRDNSSLTKVSNNLTKLGNTLANLQLSTGTLNGLRNLSNTMKSLSGLEKLSGLNSALNTLKKLPDIMSSMDKTALATFAMQMRQLGSALGPLATQIDKIGTGFNKLPSRITKVVTATNKLSQTSRSAAASQNKLTDAIDDTGVGLMATISNIQSFVASLQGIVQTIAGFMADAIEWDGIQFRFGRAFGEDAEEVYAWAQKINEALDINIQQFMQYSSLYGSLLSGFGMAQEQVTTISVGLTELSYDIWAAYNDRYKTLEDASEAVRSAITGEIEPIRNAGIALTEASMQEYLDSVGMAHVSIEKLTEAQKAEVRYAVMVNAAMNQGIVGTYARETQTAEGAVRTLTQQLKTLTQSIGSLFIPILQAFLPWVSAFVELITEAVAAVAAFFGVEMFKIDWGDTSKGGGLGSITEGAENATGALGGAADAVKKLKDYTMGFDELNIIKPDTSTASSGGAGGGATAGGGGSLGLELDTLWDQALLDQAESKVDEIKAKITGFFDEWKTEIAIIAASLGALTIASLLGQLGKAVGLGDVFTTTMGNIKKLAATAIIITLQFSLMKSSLENYMGEDGTIWDLVKAALIGGGATWLMYSMWGPAGLVLGFGVMAAASLSAIIENGGINSAESATTALFGLASAAAAVGVAWGKLGPILKNSGIGAFFALLKEGHGLGPTLAATFPKVAKAFSTIGGAVSKVLKPIGAFVGGLSTGAILTIAGILVAIASAAFFVKQNWDEVKAAVQGFFEENIKPKLDGIVQSWVDMKTSVSEAWESLKSVIPPELLEKLEAFGAKIGEVVEKVKEWFASVEWLQGIGAIFETIGGVIFSVVGGVIATAFNMLIGHIENAMQIFSGIVGIVGGVIEFIVALFTGGDVGAAWDKIWEGIVDVASGLWGLLTQPFTDLWDGIIGWFTNLWDELVGHSIVPDTINDIVEWFESMPGMVLDAIEGFYDDVIGWFDGLWSEIVTWFKTNFDIKGKVSEKWEEAKNWWNNKKAAFNEYTPKIGDIKAKVSDAWTKAKTWWNNSKGILAEYTPNIGSIKDKLSSAWTTAKNWWNNTKAALAEYTPKIGSIKDKLSSAWTTAKNWWNNTKSALAEYTPSIGSIKDKLSSAWTTAKNWWNNNVKLSIPSLSFKVTYTPKSELGSVKKAIVNALGLAGWPKLSFAANGGIFDMGSLVWAGEKGPEILANAGGGRTGVMNVDQMQQAVYEGVAAAMTAVLKSAGGNSDQEINIYLDGRQITAAVEKRQRERGMAIAGTQVYTYA